MSDEARLAIDEDHAARLHASTRRRHDDFVARETSRRMLERLATVRLAPTRIVDLGCGVGADRPHLRTRFPDASYCGVDRSAARLDEARRATSASPWSRWFARAPHASFVEADFARLPFDAQFADCLWSNLAIHWSATPHRVIVEWSRVARVGGLVALSAFGPDTLREVADAFARVDRAAHVMPFTDLHDYGDMLVAAGFTTPVVDAERVTLTYADAATLWRDVRSLGGNAAADRVRGLRGRAYRRALDDALAATRGPDGRYRLTFELVFAHAWKGEPRTTGAGDAIVRMPVSRRA